MDERKACNFIHAGGFKPDVKRRAVYVSLMLLLAAIAATLTLAKDKKHQAGSGMDERQRAIHALNRLTFGPRAGDVDRVLAIGVDRWIDQQLRPERIDDSALDRRLSALRTLRMSTQEMVENFPPQPIIRAVAEGKLEMPRDPMRRAIYQAQLEKFRGRQNKQDLSSENDAMNNDPARRQERQAAREQARTILDLPPEQRFDAILRMDPESRRIVASVLAPRQQLSALDGFTPQQRETVLAMLSPQQVVDGELRQGKLLRAVYSERQLQEVMTDFWFNHFNVFLGKGADRYMVTSYERDVIRPNALGKFKDLLLATAKSPAMLFYLDNWMSVGPDSDFALYGPGKRPQVVMRPRMRGGWVLFPRPQAPRAPQAQRKNKRNGINENYARELMELHTLGVNGGYTQKDVTEVARVFTGWTLKEPRKGGAFEFNERMHEPGDKKVLGHRIKQHGEDEGKQVLDLLARRPSTAHLICTELAQRFVSDTPPASLIDRMERTFLHKDGDIREVLRTMFHSPEFWSADAYRAKVKTPLEFVASAIRASGADVENAVPLVQVLNRMGMPLYGAQPPTGYSTRADVWVNSAALLERMNFALGLAAGRIPEVTFDAARLTATNSQDANGTLATLEQALLGGEVSRATHETLLDQINHVQPDGRNRPPQDGPFQGGPQLKASEDEQRRPPNIALIAGLLLGSPEFQRH